MVIRYATFLNMAMNVVDAFYVLTTVPVRDIIYF